MPNCSSESPAAEFNMTPIRTWVRNDKGMPTMSIFKAKGASACANQRIRFLQCCLSAAISICRPGKDEEIMIGRPNKTDHCQGRGIFGQSVS